MKEIASIIILIVIIKLTSFGIWNLKKEKNIFGAIGTGILDIAVIFEFMSLVVKIIK